MPAIAGFAMALVCELAGVTSAQRRLPALGLLLVLVALVPLADASPPDPTWLTGIYDDADFDDVIVAVVSATAAVSSILLLSPKPADLNVGPWPKKAVLLVAVPSSTFTIRAPPSRTRIATT